MSKPAKALEVAKYIVYIANRYGELITPLKLQKLLYYAQADYLVKHNGTPLFEEPIEAHEDGPIVQSVYEFFKPFGHGPILMEFKLKD